MRPAIQRAHCIIAIALVATRVSAARAEEAGGWGPVRPEETADAAAWYDRRTAALSAPTGPARTGVDVAEQGWGVPQVGWSVNRSPLRLNGTAYPAGLGSHADSVVHLTLPSGATRLAGTCGVDDTADTRQHRNPVAFAVRLGDADAWHAGPLTGPDAPATFDLDVTGQSAVTLTARAVGDGSYTPVDWAALRVTRADGLVEEVGQRRGFFDGDAPGVSFTYGGAPSGTFLSSWPAKVEELPPGRDGAVCRRVTRTDPTTGLQCVVEVKRYAHFPVVEWTARFRNTGPRDTPILESIRSMDVSFPVTDDEHLLPPTTPVILHHNTGDHAAADGYEPHATPVKPQDVLRFAPDGGRPTDHAWPYFNVELPAEHRGVIAVVSWPGQWSATASRPTNAGDELRLSGGQELTHLRLHPGEEIRTPLSVLLFYRGDADHGQNLWRRWMLADNVPRPGGQLPPAVHAAALGLYQSERTERDGLAQFARERAGLSHWWMDAGWYPCKDAFWWNLTSWDADPARFPQGIRPVSDDAHARGLKTILWFEPERAHVDSWLWTHHPEWLLAKRGESNERLLDLGNPAAAAWLLEKVDGTLTSQGIDVYRQDFNFEPLAFWREHDAADRRGITEIRNVEGYLHFWDELLRRHPNPMIDTCASGGRRLDLETLRRSVSLWTSDDSTSPEDNQSHEAGVAAWLPHFGSGVACDSAYEIRSGLFPLISFGLPSGGPMDWDLYRRETKNWEAIHDDLLGDYYPLLPHTLDTHSWMAWQFDRPELGRGVVQAFRRADSPYTTARLPLRGLDPAASYTLTDVDAPDRPRVIGGRDLLEQGLDVRIGSRPAAVILTYAKR
jgi:alpha-galactosidase